MDDLYKELEAYVNQGIQSTLAYSRSRWVEEAQNGLRSTRQDYIEGLSHPKMDSSLSGHIKLAGNWPVMIEEGYSQFDMKEGFSKSPKRKFPKAPVNEDGTPKTETPAERLKRMSKWYLTIPYRHTTTPGKRTSLPSNILKFATKLGYKKSLEQQLVRELGYHPEVSFTGYQWKNAKYDALTRIMKEYPSGAKRSSYIAFRRVSPNTNKKAWIHPGYKGLRAFNKVARDAEKFFYDYMEG